MMLELLELEDLSDHPPIIGNFNMLKQCTVMGGGPHE
jgi:hypothetical protein